MSKPKTSVYRVYIAQINQTYVDIRATDKRAAVEKAYGKWKREWGQPEAIEVTRVPEPQTGATNE
jgi:hypothetical protein